ncbi:hypothetical protein [Paracidovorax avenae]|uniref:hypothetical protein n=1 Tax=Paracidovorax avenae TaxID=80867 RepID=UPI001864CB58|nr:hypothetical protein [Paracidovorax avenae]
MSALVEEEIKPRTAKRRRALVQGLMSICGNDNPGALRRRMQESVDQTLSI